MRILNLQGFLLTCSVGVLLLPSSESGELISKESQHTTRNFPLKRFINAVGWNARKVLQLNDLPSVPKLNPVAGDLHGAFSQNPNVGKIWGPLPLPQPDFDGPEPGGPPFQQQPLILVDNHPNNHPPFSLGPPQQIGWGPVGPQPAPNHHHHPHDFNKGQGWSKGPQKPHHHQPAHFHLKGPHHEGWGWKPRDVCEILTNRTITTEADLEPGWRILRVVNATARDEVMPRVLLDPPIIHVPTPPLQLTADATDTIERTFFEEVSIDFDAAAKNAGYSVTRNVFSTSNDSFMDSSRNSFQFGDGEESGNVLRGTVSILKFKRSATPLRGRFDVKKYFESGLGNATEARRRGETAPPVERFFRKDLLYASELFERILDFEEDDEGLLGESGGQLEENWMEMPTLVGVVEKHSLPDIDHSERTVLDVEFNFGLPTSNFEFQRVGTTIEQWKDMRNLRDRKRRMERAGEVSESFGDLGGFLASSEDFVRSRMKLQRTFLGESFIEAEERVQSQYVISQYLICPTATGVCGECPLDPIVDRPQMADWKSGAGSRMRRTPRVRSMGG